jgi:hypothetical protein
MMESLRYRHFGDNRAGTSVARVRPLSYHLVTPPGLRPRRPPLWSRFAMLGRYRTVWHLVISMLLAAFLATVPVEWISLDVVASDECSTYDEIRATTCRLLDGQPEWLPGRLEGPGATATYRLDVLGPAATVNVMLSSEDDRVTASLIDWRGTVLGQAKPGTRAARKELTATVPLAGVYGLRVEGDVSDDGARYAVGASVAYPDAAWQPVWPLALAGGAGALTGERQVLRTPRGGTPEGGVAVARALRAPPEGEVGDFTLVADVQFEKIVGPSALTIRFRYEPEAGGGTGYVLSLDPFGGTATLDGFDEGQRKSIVNHVALPVVPNEQSPSRLILQAIGPNLKLSLDGQTVLEASDARYPRGLIAVGVVTWSDPVAVTFDHVQVTVPR